MTDDEWNERVREMDVILDELVDRGIIPNLVADRVAVAFCTGDVAELREIGQWLLANGN